MKSKMKVEFLTEDNEKHTIKRVHFKEGYIDFITCDMAYDPNTQIKPSYSLNAGRCYVRLNNNRWIRRDNLNNTIFEIYFNKASKEEEILDILTASEFFFLCETPYTYLDD